MINITQMTEVDSIVIEYKATLEKISELNRAQQVSQHMLDTLKKELKELKELLNSFALTKKIFGRKRYLEDKEKIIFDINYKENSYHQYEKDLNKQNIDISLLEKKKKELSEIAEKSISNQFEEINRAIKSQIIYNESGLPIIDDSKIEQLSNCIDVLFEESTFSFDDIALVHATNYFPHIGVIKSTQDSQAIINEEVEINGVLQNASAFSHRDTVHFSLNGKVSSHAYGSWDDCKYIIIEPIKYQLDVINSISPEDTWTNGSIKLSSEAVILVSIDDYEKLDKNLTNKHKVVLFRGNSQICVEKILLLMGYKPQKVGMHNWTQKDSNNENINYNILSNYVLRYYPEKNRKRHYYTPEMDVSNNLVVRDLILSVLRKKTVNTKDGLEITPIEFTTLFKFFAKKNENLQPNISQEKLFTIFLKNYGVRYEGKKFFLLDDKSIILSYSTNLNFDMIVQLYQLFQTLDSENLKIQIEGSRKVS